MTEDFDDEGAGAPPPLKRNLLIILPLIGVCLAGLAVLVAVSQKAPQNPPANGAAEGTPDGPRVSQGADLEGFGLHFAGWHMEGGTLVGVVTNSGTQTVGPRIVRASAFDRRGVELNGALLDMPDVPEGGKGEVRVSLPPRTARVVLGCTF